MLTLDDIRALPNDPSEEHLIAVGLLPKPAPPPSIIPAATAIPTPSAVTPRAEPSADWKTKLAATAPHVPTAVPPIQPVAPDLGSPVTPGNAGAHPTDELSSPGIPSLPHLNFKERQALPITSAGAPANSSASFRAQIERLQDQKANPWGSPENHPGLFGKIGHYAAKIGNIAGDVLAPATMANIPGTELNKTEQLREAEGKEAKAEGRETAAKTAESENELRAAEAKKNLAMAEREPGTTAEREVFKDLTTGDNGGPRINPDTNKPYTPLEAFEAVRQAEQKSTTRPESIDQAAVDAKMKETNPQTGKPFTAYEARVELAADIAGNKGEQKTPPHITVMKGGRPHIMERDPGTGEYTVDRGEAPPNYAMVAPVLQQRTFTQQEKMFDLRQQALTSATKSMIEAAPTVTHLADRIDPLIDKLQNDLGPGAGRWSEFWAGKVGTKNPEYTKLRSDLGLLQTALMRMHVGARGGGEMMTHFKDLIDQGKQDPENLKASLSEIRQYANELEQKGIAGGMNPKVIGTEKSPPKGKTTVYDQQGTEHYVLSDKVDKFLQDPKYKGWSRNAPTK